MKFGKKHLVLTDPLVIFALIGFVIIGVNQFFPEAEEQKPKIVVTQQVADAIIKNRAAILGHPLSPEEQNSLLQKYIDEEVLVREAVTRGLPLADGMMRKALREKMEFLLAEELPEPGENELDKLRQSDPERYMTPRSISFEHIFFNNEDSKRAEEAFEKFGQMETNPAGLGDKFWLGTRMNRYYTAQLLTLFGHKFVQSIWKMQPGEWLAPIQSARGWHIVRVNAVHDPEPLDPETARARLLEKWRNNKRAEMRSYWIKKFSENYEIENQSQPVANGSTRKSAQLQQLTGNGVE